MKTDNNSLTNIFFNQFNFKSYFKDQPEPNKPPTIQDDNDGRV